MSLLNLGGDITLNAVPYVRGTYGDNSLGWKEGPAVPNQSGDFLIPVEARWDRGFFAGMGETLRVEKTSAGYAFSVNWDCSAYGFARLTGKKTTFTPTYVPVDKPCFGFEDTSTTAGDAVFNVGSFAKVSSGVANTQDITHGLSVAPKAVIFWTAGATSGVVIAGGRNCIGITDGTTSRSASWNSEDAAATSNAARFWSTGCISLQSATGTATPPIATISAVGASTFTLTWANNDTGVELLHFMVIGGSEVSASVDAWTGTGGSVSVTGVGFTPDVVMHLSSSHTAVGSTTNASVSLGVMDSSGNQWAVFNYSADGSATTNSTRGQKTTCAILDLQGGAGTFTSMDADGFTVGGTSFLTYLFGSLSIKGLRAKAGAVAKVTSATTQTAVSLPFTTTGFFLASVGSADADPTVDHALLSLGAASGTTAVESSCWTDEDAQADADTYSVDDPALAFEILNVATGAEDSLATCGNIDMGVAGWLTWSAASAVAEQICYLAFAPLATSASSYIFLGNGQHMTAVSVDSTPTITEIDAKDFGAGAQVGKMVKGGTTESLWRIPLGPTVDATSVSAISSAGVPTYTPMTGIKALAFSSRQVGAQSVVDRAHTKNKVATSDNNCASWGDDFSVGTTGETITSMVDTGNVTLVATDSSLHELPPTGVSRRLSRFNTLDKSENYGAGLLSPSGATTAYYNHRGLYFWNGERLVQVGPDANPVNRAIPNVSNEPFRGEHLETVYGSDEWVWSAYQVVEGLVTYTYILAGNRSEGGTIWHTYARLAGACRLVPIDGALDSEHRLWFADVSGGVFGFFQLGSNGEPDAGRDNTVGYGSVSSSSYLYLPETDFDLPHVTKVLRDIETNWRGTSAEATLYTMVAADGGVGATYGTAGAAGQVMSVAGVKHAYADTAAEVVGTKLRPVIQVDTTASFAYTDLQLLSVIMRAAARPAFFHEIEIVIDTRKAFESGTGAPNPASGAAQRAALIALSQPTAGPISATDWAGNSKTVMVNDVIDLATFDTPDGPHYLLMVKAYRWVTTSTSA